MKSPLACADFTFPLLGHDAVLDLIGALDFDGVDIGLFEGRSHLWPSREFKNLPRAAKQLAKKLSDRGLRAADIFLQMNGDFVPFAINHPQSSRRRKARDWFARSLEYAVRVGSKHLTTLPGVAFDSEDLADSLARTHEELAWRLEQARDAKITFSVEAHVGSIVSHPKTAAELVASVPGLTLTLDYTHFTRMGLADKVVEPLIPLASHFHVRGACKGRLQASFKQNTIDYSQVLRAMRKSGYRGYLGVEYVWIDWEHCNEVDNLSETVQFRDFIRSAQGKN
jgi:sugar phosphate isomerase/epimerase